MNFYNPLSNVPDDSDAWSSGDFEVTAQYHWDEARKALDQIRKRDPIIAEQLTTFMTHCLLAANAYSHDMFERRNPSNEDVETRIRKNR